MTVDSIGYKMKFGQERRALISYPTDGFQEEIEALVEGLGYSRGFLASAGPYFYTADHVVSLIDYCVGTDAECGLLTSIKEPD